MSVGVILIPVYHVLSIVIGLYMWTLIASAVLSWLVVFNVLNTRNRAVYVAVDILYRLTEPALRPLRRLLPNLGGLDLSPLVLILILVLLQEVLDQLVLSIVAR